LHPHDISGRRGSYSVRMRRLFLLVIGLTIAAGSLSAQSGHALFQQALTKERAEGKLLDAIRLYERVAKEFASDRPLAAKALVQMGRCYEKLGRAEARKAYERVLQEYADQRDPAVEARARLASLSRPPAASPPTLAIRRVYEGPGIDWCNGLSSDIRYLSHPDWLTGNLAVADLRTGEVRRVTSEGTIHQRSGAYAECSVFAPDDKRLAYFWKHEGAAELRIAPIDGSKPAVVYRAGIGAYLMPFDWSRDARQILAGVFDSGAAQIVLVSTADGSARVVKSFESGVTGGAAGLRLSPDGRFIVYNRAPDPASARKDIFVIAADGTGERALVEHPADDYVLGWAADGKRLFFSSNRAGSFGVWAIDMEEGHPRGAATLVKGDVGSITPVRLLNGTLYYTTVSQMSDVYVGDIDADRGTLRAAPVLARKHFSGTNAAPNWSPDGASLAYRSTQTTTDALTPPALVSILDLKTGDERQIRPAIAALDFNDGPHWSPDGRSLLVIGLQNTPAAGVWKVDVATGTTTPLVKTPRGQWLLHALWSRDGNSIVYAIGNPPRVVRRDIVTGAEVELFNSGDTGGVQLIALSPDGQWLALRSRLPASKRVVRLMIMPAAGGEAREIFRPLDGESIGRPIWLPDGRFVYFAKSTVTSSTPQRPAKPEYWRIRPDGSDLERVPLDISANAFSFSPDGRRLVFASVERKSELWALENMTPAPASIARRSARQ